MGLKILVVDDEPDIVAVISKFLEVWGYEPIPAESGKKALQILREKKNHVDIIILDVNLPGETGFEIAERIKKDPRLASIPIIFLTARAAAEDMTKGMQLFAWSYLAKPFEPHELRAVIEQITGIVMRK